MSLQIFENKDFGKIRVQTHKCESFFVANDICEALGISDARTSISHLDEDEKLIQKILVSGQNREIWTVNESGLYNLIFSSNKLRAKSFEKWVTNQVLTSVPRPENYYFKNLVINEYYNWMKGLDMEVQEIINKKGDGYSKSLEIILIVRELAEMRKENPERDENTTFHKAGIDAQINVLTNLHLTDKKIKRIYGKLRSEDGIWNYTTLAALCARSFLENPELYRPYFWEDAGTTSVH